MEKLIARHRVTSHTSSAVVGYGRADRKFTLVINRWFLFSLLNCFCAQTDKGCIYWILIDIDNSLSSVIQIHLHLFPSSLQSTDVPVTSTITPSLGALERWRRSKPTPSTGWVTSSDFQTCSPASRQACGPGELAAQGGCCQ